MSEPLIKSKEEIHRQLVGDSQDALPGVPTLSNQEFARVVGAVGSGEKVDIRGTTFDGSEQHHPVDVALLAHRVSEPNQATKDIHNKLIQLARQVETKDPAIEETAKELEVLATAASPTASNSRETNPMAAMVAGLELASMTPGPRLPDGTNVTPSGAGAPGGERVLGG